MKLILKKKWIQVILWIREKATVTLFPDKVTLIQPCDLHHTCCVVSHVNYQADTL